jgi:hypothetical protein
MWEAKRITAVRVNDYCKYSGSYNIDAAELTDKKGNKTNALIFSKLNDYLPTNSVSSGDIVILKGKEYTVGVVRPENLYEDDNYKDLKGSFKNFLWI